MLKEMWATALTGVALLGGVALERPLAGAAPYRLQERDSVQRTLRLAAGTTRRVEISHRSGPVTVTAAEGDTVEVLIERTLEAQDATAMTEAKRMSEPSMTENAQGIVILAAGTLRGRCDEPRDPGDRSARDRRSQPPYRVRARVEVRVPTAVELHLCTINGPASVSGVSGSVTVSDVNGAIDARDIAGAVSLTTVNGPITADVRARPDRNWQLRTVNGSVTLRLPSDASADLRVRTRNGDVLTDFETTPLAPEPSTLERRGTMRVIRSSRSVSARIGQGGPEVSIETVNGSVRVQKR